MIPGGQGGIHLPASNSLPELHRVLIELDKRIRTISAAQPSTGGATVLGGSTSGSSSVQQASSTSQSDSGLPTISFLSFRTLATDPVDGLVLIDDDGYGVFTTVRLPVPSIGLKAVSVPVGVASGVFRKMFYMDFDETKFYVNLEGALLGPLRVDVDLSGKEIIFRNGTSGDPAFVSLSIAQADSSPQDSGIIVPQGSLAWVKLNTGGTALELVEYYG